MFVLGLMTVTAIPVVGVLPLVSVTVAVTFAVAVNAAPEGVGTVASPIAPNSHACTGAML